MNGPEIKHTVEPADHQREERQHRPDVVQRAQPLTPCGAGASGAGLGVHGDGKADRAEVEQDAKRPGHDARDEQRADRGLGQQPIDHKDH